MDLIDVSHPIEAGLQTYPGLPPPVIGEFLTRAASRAKYAPGTEFQIGRIEMVGNTGTYLDSPFHRFAGGVDLASLPLSRLAALPVVVIRAAGAGSRAVGAEAVAGLDVRGRAVLVHTGWDRHWRTDDYFEGHPYLTGGAAERLRDGGVALVGIDSLNIDDTAGGARPVHTTLLGAGIPVLEHLTGLDRVPDQGGLLFAVPPPVKEFGTFPVRAFVMVDR